MDVTEMLKEITGVVLISKDGEDLLCCLEDMTKSKYFTVGQIFNAVRILNGKSVEDYKRKWPKYKDSTGNISNDWKALEQAKANCESDYDFLVEVCKQLNEDVPDVIPRETVQKNLSNLKNKLTA